MFQKQLKAAMLLATMACQFGSALPHGKRPHSIQRDVNPMLMARATNPMTTPFFSKDFEITPEICDNAQAVGSIAYMKVTGKDVTLCEFRYLFNNLDIAKFSKVGSTFTTLKHENYDEFGGTWLKRTCAGARKSIGHLSEGLSRALGATEKPYALEAPTPLDLYMNMTPTWVQCDSAADFKDYAQNLQAGLVEQGVDVSLRTAQALPTIVLTIKNDVFLQSLDADDLRFLKRYFNPATFRNPALRKFFTANMDRLLEVKRNAKDKGADLSPLLSGIFADIEGANNYLSTNGMIRQALKTITSKLLFDGVPFIIALGIARIMQPWFDNLINNKAVEVVDKAKTADKDWITRNKYTVLGGGVAVAGSIAAIAFYNDLADVNEDVAYLTEQLALAPANSAQAIQIQDELEQATNTRRNAIIKLSTAVIACLGGTVGAIYAHNCANAGLPTSA